VEIRKTKGNLNTIDYFKAEKKGNKKVKVKKKKKRNHNSNYNTYRGLII